MGEFQKWLKWLWDLVPADKRSAMMLGLIPGFVATIAVQFVIFEVASSQNAVLKAINGSFLLPTLVQAKRLDILDDQNRSRITLSVIDGSPKVVLFDTGENVRAAIELRDNEPSVSLFDNNKVARAFLSVDKNQVSSLVLADEDGKTHVGAQVKRNGSPSVDAIGRNDDIRATISELARQGQGNNGAQGPVVAIFRDNQMVESLPHEFPPLAQPQTGDASPNIDPRSDARLTYPPAHFEREVFQGEPVMGPAVATPPSQLPETSDTSRLQTIFETAQAYDLPIYAPPHLAPTIPNPERQFNIPPSQMRNLEDLQSDLKQSADSTMARAGGSPTSTLSFPASPVISPSTSSPSSRTPTATTTP